MRFCACTVAVGTVRGIRKRRAARRAAVGTVVRTASTAVGVRCRNVFMSALGLLSVFRLGLAAFGSVVFA